jgi:transcriptional regulator with XRE-family HTH domain
MTAQQWTTGRQNAGSTQVQAAEALGISQPYLSQLETGSRAAGPVLIRKAAALYRLPATALPLPEPQESEAVGPDGLQRELAALGYPRFAHVSPAERRNPAGVVFSAVTQGDLDTRLVEALPWVMSTYTDLDWQWLRDRAKLGNVQNRLGYLVSLAKDVVRSRAEKSHEIQALSEWERDLEEARLAREDTLCRDSMPPAERSWLKVHRPPAAEHWNLLTGLTLEQLPYVEK